MELDRFGWETGVAEMPPLFFGAPGMARSAIAGAIQLLWWQLDDLEVKVVYRPGKGNG